MFLFNVSGKRGNLTERKVPVLISMLLGVACVICLLYFILWQTYVLRFEFAFLAQFLKNKSQKNVQGILGVKQAY